MNTCDFTTARPSMDQWLRALKSDPASARCGMYLIHNGTVRETARALVREGDSGAAPVTGMLFDYDPQAVARAIETVKAMPGILFVRVWLNRGRLALGDDIMYVMIGGDIRPHVVDALQALVGTIKSSCVTEQEQF